MGERKVFYDSIEEIDELQGHTQTGLKVQAAKPEHLTDRMSLHFSLAIPDKAREELESLVASGKVVSIDDLNSKYAVSEDESRKLMHWLKTQGFENITESKNHTSVFARATIDRIQNCLDVKMVRVTRDGITYTAAKNAPSLPSEIASSVHAIIGLQPFRHAHKHFRRVMPNNRIDGSPGDRQDVAPSTNVANRPPYLVSEILTAYSAIGLSMTGKGQEIAILIDTFPRDADLKEFWHKNGLAIKASQITKINVNGGSPPPPEGEETLDASWTSGIAPGAAIRIYASGSLQFSELNRALDQILTDLAVHPSMRQLSVSLGLGELFTPRGTVRTQHQVFLQLAAAGVNVFVSSGDAGSNPDDSGHGSNGPLQVEYAASDPCVVGVGGTSLVLGTGGSVREETGWPDGGGGKSKLFKRPSWQKGPGIPQGANRLVPDVSLTADPNEGALVILNGVTQQIGGTSWSAPVWAGFCALINEARSNAGKPPLPFLNPLIYPLIGTPCFRDIVAGSNGAYDAGPSYDLVSGIGVPNVKELIRALTH